MAAAHLALAAAAAGRQVDRAFAEASLAMARAARADRRYAAAEPWLDAARPAFGGDSLRTALVVGRRLGDAGLVDAAVAAARAAVRAGPASVDAVTLASDLLRDAGRPREALAVAADYVRREPGRAAGWVLAGMAAARAGDDTLAARAFARVEAIEPRYFSRLRVVAPKGADEAAAARARAGRQPPATVEQLAAAGP
jgi:tetratricopeptide (TPR) repeat protein